MQIPKHDDLSSIIDTCFIAVNESKVGPILQCPDPSNLSVTQVNQVAFDTFRNVVVGVLNKALKDL